MIPKDIDGNYMPILRCGVKRSGIDRKRNDLTETAVEDLAGRCGNKVTRHARCDYPTTFRCMECGETRQWGNLG